MEVKNGRQKRIDATRSEKKMPVTGELLHRIEKGGTLDELANELDMRKSILVAIIEFLLRAGYLYEVCTGKECAGCSMSKICSVPVPGGGKGWVKMYVFTEKGLAYIKGVKADVLGKVK